MRSNPRPDLRSQGTGARRPIAWEKLDAEGLPRAKRTTVGRTWRERMRQEHLAVGAFALLTQELAEIGCDSAVMSLVARAAADEIRHADVCGKMATALLGQAMVPKGWKGLPSVPMHTDATRETRALLHLVEMCCLSESITAVYFTEMIARASHPVAKAAVESLLEDEVDHSRVGWAYLESRLRTKTLAGLAEALPAMLERTVGRALQDLVAADADDPSMEAFGYLGNTTGHHVVAGAFRDVIQPGLARVGLDVSSVRF